MLSTRSSRVLKSVISLSKKQYSHKGDFVPPIKKVSQNNLNPSIYIATSCACTFLGITFTAYKMETDPHFLQKVQVTLPWYSDALIPYRKFLGFIGIAKRPEDPNVKLSTVKVKESESVVVPVLKPDIDEFQNKDGDIVDLIEEIETGTAPIDTVPNESSTEVEVISEKTEEVEVADTSPPSLPVPAALEIPKETEPSVQALTLPIVSAELRALKLREDAANNILEDLSLQSASYRRELELSLLKDLEGLDESGLRMRIAQLASEFFERTKWEGIRLHQSLRQIESDLSRRYLDLLAEQRSEFEIEVNKKLFEHEKTKMQDISKQLSVAQGKFESQLQDALRAQAEGFNKMLQKELASQHETLKTEMQDALNIEVTSLRQAQVNQLVSMQNNVEALEKQLGVFNKIADETESKKVASHGLHKASAALLALERALEDSQPVGKQLGALKASCKDDALVESIVAAIPASASTTGVPTLPELKSRFNLARSEVRKHALSPQDAPKLVGHLIGTVLSIVSLPPKGYVTGNGVEEILARAAHMLDQGHLDGALVELAPLDDYSHVLLQDWTRQARDRLVLEQSVKILRAGSAVRHSWMAK